MQGELDAIDEKRVQNRQTGHAFRLGFYATYARTLLSFNAPHAHRATSCKVNSNSRRNSSRSGK